MPAAAGISDAPGALGTRAKYLSHDPDKAVNAVLKLLTSLGWLAAVPDGSRGYPASGTSALVIRVGLAVRKP
jgi:hypothetical protein